MKFYSIEGNNQKLDGGSMFGNAPKEMWKQWSSPDPLNRIPLATRALLVQKESGENFLFETGIGAFFEPKLKARFGLDETEHLLLKNLENLGLNHSAIDHVILSHLHFDHAGGLLSAYDDPPLRLLFPNATFYVGKKHWERACRPHPRDKTSFNPLINKLLEDSNRLELITKPTHPNLPVTFSQSDGHTPGMLLSHFQTEQGPLVFTADLIPGRYWMHLPISMGFDRYPELIIDEKKALLDSLYEEKGYCFFTHCPLSPCVTVKKDEKEKFIGQEVNVSELKWNG